MLSGLLVTAGAALFAWLILSRLLFLAPVWAGWAMYLANIGWEFAERRARLPRLWIETGAVAVALGLLWLGGVPFPGIAMAGLALAAIEIGNRAWERQLLTGVYARLDPVGLRASAGAGEQFPAPSVHPNLTLNLEGPFTERLPVCHLGWLEAEVAFQLALVVGNHTRFPTQHPVQVGLAVPAGWRSEGETGRALSPLAPGGVERVGWTLNPGAVAAAGEMDVQVRWDGEQCSLRIAYDGVRRVTAGEVREAAILRYPGARRAAFSWRGDMDLYDTSSLQSIAGLEDALGLGARYRIAQTLFLATRLSLDEGVAREWAEHYGVNRGAAEIPRFVAWLQEHVDLCLTKPYPAQADRPYVMELGNHGHLHYDTDTAGAPGNGWKAGTRPGEGRYPWSGEDTSSFGDQRDNILEAGRWCERLLGFVPRSWAKPGRGNDCFTPAAVEAAGCEVATGSDIRARDNVLRQPPPHHPAGTRIVELTARYPSDPQHVYHVAMLVFWMHRAHRLGIPMVMLVHQHMRQFAGLACARFTEYLLRYALERFQGDLYLDTVYGIGSWWRDVLSEDTRRLHVTLEDGQIRVINATDRDLADVPVDLRLAGGERMTRLVSVPAGGEVVVTLGDGAAERICVRRG